MVGWREWTKERRRDIEAGRRLRKRGITSFGFFCSLLIAGVLNRFLEVMTGIKRKLPRIVVAGLLGSVFKGELMVGCEFTLQ